MGWRWGEIGVKGVAGEDGMDNGPVHGVVDWLGVGWVPVSVFVCVYVCTSVNNELIRKFVSLRILSLSPYPFPS